MVLLHLIAHNMIFLLNMSLPIWTKNILIKHNLLSEGVPTTQLYILLALPLSFV